MIFIGNRLIIPKHKDIHENLFCLAHNNLGHFGTEESYAMLRNNFYWPNMHQDLVSTYVPSCTECQWNKNLTLKPAGPLHPLPIPNKCFDSVAIDFIGPLPNDSGFDRIATMTDRLGADIQLAACNMNMTTEEFAAIFSDWWFCKNGCPSELITNCDKLFVSHFWKALMKLSGIKHKMSTAFHPQTDGSSEQTNKTVIQALRFHVEQNQAGWAKALPKVCFDIINTINASTGFTPFMLKSAHYPCLIPPLLNLEDPQHVETPTAHTTNTTNTNDTPHAGNNTNTEDTLTLHRPTAPTEQHNGADIPPMSSLPSKNITPRTSPSSNGKNKGHCIINQLAEDLLDAQDSLVAAKISQACHANKDRSPDPEFNVRDCVLLVTAH